MFSEDKRYILYRWGAHLSWWSAFAWTALLTYVNITRPPTAIPSTFQRVSGLFIILLMGLAIALGSALSRMRLARTISGVFETGMAIARNERKELFACRYRATDDERLQMNSSTTSRAAGYASAPGSPKSLPDASPDGN